MQGESSREREDYLQQHDEGTTEHSNSSMAMYQLPPGAAHSDHARGATTGSYEYQDSAYATAGSRLNSEGSIQPQAYNSRIQPPKYAAPPLPPSSNDTPVIDARAAPVANGNLQPAAYPTYNSQQPTTTHHQHNPFQHHPAKPVPPVEEVGRGWAGFSLQDIRDLSPKAKKRLIW